MINEVIEIQELQRRKSKYDALSPGVQNKAHNYYKDNVKTDSSFFLHSSAWWRQCTVPPMLCLFWPPGCTTVSLIPSSLRHLCRKVWHII